MKKNILIVDDDIACRKACAKSLSANGFKISEAEDGDQAIELLSTNHYDIVLTDIMMPGTDGIGVLKYIKESTPECEVILMTAYPTVETSVEALRFGAADYLTKPLELDDLNSRIEECLELKKPKNQKQNEKEIYTSYDVSKLCSVTVPTVTNWVEQEILPAYKTPGGHRRIKREDLVGFLKKYEMPFPEELQDTK